jgi:SAM-dependent methyltransferase
MDMDNPGDAYIEWKDWDDATFGKFTDLDKVYFAAETSIMAQSPPRLLEIGFGNGSFLGWIKSLGGEIFGVETNARLNARARDFFGSDCFFEDLRDPRLNRFEGHFTHIVAFDVIEHISIEHLPALLERIRDLLATDGRLILRFPNGDSPFGRMIQHGDPTHVTTMGQFKLVYLARNAGLRVVEIRAPALPLRGVGLVSLIKRAGVKLGRYFVARLLSILYYGGKRISLETNYVAILVRARSG